MKDNFVKRIKQKIKLAKEVAMNADSHIEDFLLTTVVISVYEDALSIYQEEKNGGVKDGSKA